MQFPFDGFVLKEPDRVLSRHRSLRREADAAQQVRETRVASQSVESGIHPDEGHSIRTGEIGFLEPGEGTLLVAQLGVYACHVESANVALSRLCLDRA
jgi:hypothetical protein